MRQVFLAVCSLLIAFSGTSQIDINNTLNKINLGNSGAGSSSLTNEEVIRGLKEALSTGANKSTASASKMDGFYKNSMIKIPFPAEAMRIKTTAENLGMKPQVDKFVLTLNRAAEEASKEAAPIFLQAITSMTLTDGFSILKGGNNAATNYLKGKTSEELKVKFRPIVKRAIQKVELTRYWNPIMTKYNRVPGVQKMNPDLEAYVTEKTLEGLFKLIEQEELKIRQDPASRITDLLRRVFGG